MNAAWLFLRRIAFTSLKVRLTPSNMVRWGENTPNKNNTQEALRFFFGSHMSPQRRFRRWKPVILPRTIPCDASSRDVVSPLRIKFVHKKHSKFYSEKHSRTTKDTKDTKGIWECDQAFLSLLFVFFVFFVAINISCLRSHVVVQFGSGLSGSG